MSERRQWLLIVLVLLGATALRGWHLGEAPPGLSHDEVINGLVARDILAGHHAIYFTTAGVDGPAPVATGGHEPLFQYAQAATIGLFGENWVGIRWPAFAFGLLGVATVYAFARRLFDFPTALLSGAWLSISFWPLFYARVGLRAITLPFVAGLFGIFFLRTVGIPVRRRLSSSWSWLPAGVTLGLSLYTYLAARILPVIAVACAVYVALTRTSQGFPWAQVLRMLLVALLIAAPLAVWLVAHPEAEARVSEVRQPLDRLLAGDPSLVWRNLVANLGFFTFVGDPWFHQGLPGRPIFAEPVSAILFLLGVAIAIWKWRRPRYGLLLIWLLGALVPSVLSSHAPPGLASDAPSSIRDILAVVPAFLFPAFALTEAGRWLARRARRQGLLSSVRLVLPVVIVLLLPCLGLTLRDYFGRWAQRSDVRYLYQADLTAVGHHLDAIEPHTAVTVGGLSVTTLDRPTLAFSARTSVADIRLCDPRQTLVVPGSSSAQLLVPQVVPFDDGGDFRRLLERWAEAESHGGFMEYSVADRQAIAHHLGRLQTEAALPDGTPISLPVSFGDRLILEGYEWTRPPGPGKGQASLVTYWRVASAVETRLKAFVHVVDQNGELVAQHDGLASPSEGWASGDLIVQRHVLGLPSDGGLFDVSLRVGLYQDDAQAERLRALTADHLLLSYPPRAQNG